VVIGERIAVTGGGALFSFAAMGSVTDLATGSEWSGWEVRGAAASRCRELARAGVGRGGCVVIAHDEPGAFFADLFAVWSLGACAAVVNSQLTPDELSNVVGFSEAAAVIVGEKTCAFTAPRGVTVMPAASRSGGTAGPTTLTIDASSSDAALILFTSGTTGDPKGVVHTFGSLAARVALNHERISSATMARTLCVLPMHFGHGLIGNCLTPLFAGGRLFVARGDGLVRAARLSATLVDHDITFMSSVPSFWKIALQASLRPGRATLRQVNVGSAPVSADLINAVADWTGTRDVRNMYGITETANWLAGGSLKDRPAEDGLVGPMWGGTAAVYADGRIHPQGAGEIVVTTPSLMSGYLRRPDLTNAAIIDGWYHTGDIGTVDAEGTLRLTGRIRNEINYGGMKVSPEEIDLLLERHPAVAEACAFGVPDPVAGEIVAVAVRVATGASATAQELRAWCLGRLKRDAVPQRWFMVAEIPKTDRGKLNREKVRAACLPGR
jgi:acyl-CoA synthetase (AMP-forming)/AMP-acid ligase II